MKKGMIVTAILCLFVTVFAQAMPSNQGQIPGNNWGAWTQIKKLTY